MYFIHPMLQQKGGVGKSMMASMLYQVLQKQGKDVVGFDTDPGNATFSGYKEFNVHRIQLLKDDSNIDARRFDEMINAIYDLPDGSHIIIDNGASSFFALLQYFIESDTIANFQSDGHLVHFHSAITGGQALLDTLSGFAKLVKSFPTVPVTVWLNHYFGEIAMDGKVFEEFLVYQENKEHIKAVINVPGVNQATLGKDLEELFAKRQSFKTGIATCRSIAMRSRLNKYWSDLSSMIEQIDFEVA